MPFFSRLRRVSQLSSAVAVFALALAAQTSTPHTSGGIPMSEEKHHHFVFGNQYVNIYFVEIPPHETTLLHHHSLPYISVPPGGPDAPPQPSVSASSGSAAPAPRVSYADGDFSHAVTNSGEVVVRNVAVELIREQGTVRSGCAAVVRDALRKVCSVPDLTVANPVRHFRLFDTDEVLAESWDLGPGVTTPPLDDGMDMLIAGLTDVSITGNFGIDSANALRGGELWVPAGSKPVFKTASDRGGHFIAITFKDSAPPSH